MRNMIRAAFTITILAALAIAGRISFATADQTPSSTSTAPYVVHIKNFAFNPSSLTVPVGATVIFKNEDSAAHTATASGKNGFDSGKLDNGAQFKYVFTKAGKYDYACQFHPNMKATIVVSNNPPPAASPTPFTPPSPSGY